MTIGGVEALARKAGIPTENVREAAALVRRGPTTPVVPSKPTPLNKLINGPTRIAFERIVDLELPEPE
jgi:hypothetical protein